VRLIWKGKYESEQQLPVADLPANAVRFKEPDTPAKLSLVASIFVIPVIIIIVIAIIIKLLLDTSADSFSVLNTWGILLAFLMVIPHELIHAIAFPKHAEVQLWYSLKNMMAFVFTTCPMSKSRFIFVSLLPNIIFGFLPLIMWMLIPLKYDQISGILFSFSTFSLMMGVGDYLNVYNAAIQMPRNSITQLSGFHSYWYIP
jgi:hypothetical protein